MMLQLVTKTTPVLLVLFCVTVLASAQGPFTVIHYPLPQMNSNPWQLTIGPDGAIWYTVSCPYTALCSTTVFDAIGRVDNNGNFTEFPLPRPSSGPYGITTGPDGALWFTEMQANKIGRITTTGIVTEYDLPTPDASPYQITTGPDGALWFTESNSTANKIGRITTTGAISEYALPWVCCSPGPLDITTGSDGALWFTNLNSYWIGRITTGGVITKYSLPVLYGDYGIATGPDGALWFTGATATGAAIWRITTDGNFSNFSVPTKDAGLTYITQGSDKALWFTEAYVGQIGRVTNDGAFTEYAVGGTFSWGPVAITKGADGNVWFGKWGYIGKLILPDTTPPSITLNASPKKLWPPNGQMVPITFWGKITDDGSGLVSSSIEYAVKDEYGLVQPRGHLTLDDAGKYSFTVLLRASREGNDKDGRHYSIRVSARDKASNKAARSVGLIVPHDVR